MKASDYLLFHEAVSYLGITQGEFIDVIAEGRITPLIHYREEVLDGTWESRGVLYAENAKSQIIKTLGDSDLPIQIRCRTPLFEDEYKFNSPTFIEDTCQAKLLFDRNDLDLLRPNHFCEPLVKDQQYLFRKDGDSWKISFQGKSLPLARHKKGFLYIAHLLGHPKMTFSGLDMVKAVSHISDENCRYDENAVFSEQINRGIEASDRKSLREIKARAEQLSEEIASCANPLERMEMEEELERLSDYLDVNSGLNGKPRLLYSDDKKANDAVKKAIREAIVAIKSTDLQKHLLSSIKTKSGIRYESNICWSLK